MFYSPKKNIESFIEAKNEEIKALKQKILGTRVTYDDMNQARDCLDKLKASHLLLEREDHLEIKNLLRTTQQAVADLSQKKNCAIEQLEARKRETQEMADVMDDLSHKQDRTHSYQKEVTEARDKLRERKERKNKQILELQDEISLRRQEIQKELSISDELANARQELRAKIQRAKKALADKCEENRQLRDSIAIELDTIDKLDHTLETDELREENLLLKISNEEKQIQNYQQKIESSKTFLQRAAEDKLTLIKESETEGNIDALIKMVSENNECRQKEQDECSSVIASSQAKLHAAIFKKQGLEKKVGEKREVLKEMKEKGHELKHILNSIFHQDSNVVKILAEKKVYEESDSSVPSCQNKSTAAESEMKHNMLEMLDTTDNFFMTNLH